MRLNMEGNQVVLVFEYTTGDAAGQNMVTLCTEAICTYILEHTPVKPECWFIESNYSGDKKATTLSFTSVRGKKVTAEAIITQKVVKEVLGTTPKAIAQYWQSSSVTAVQSGGIGIQGHFANGLTAIFLATGQDVACVAEAYVGITRMEVNSNDDLYVCVTLPSLTVGTVGGGTHLPTQKECLKLIGCEGPGSARKFARDLRSNDPCRRIKHCCRDGQWKFFESTSLVRKEKINSSKNNVSVRAQSRTVLDCARTDKN
jgi:hydroxymethylglutaryl-CoA reductase (NADPH)